MSGREPPSRDAPLDRARVHHIAKLAALSLTDAEADRFTGELSAIVRYVAELDGVDTAAVTPTAHVQLERAPLRADEALPGLSHEDALRAAPRVEHEGFAVPAFMEG
jgi:aspartyl-tRNA(Asn)/glutamyl-tRNA(Gln) amidotransferase subunit C